MIYVSANTDSIMDHGDRAAATDLSLSPFSCCLQRLQDGGGRAENSLREK